MAPPLSDPEEGLGAAYVSRCDIVSSAEDGIVRMVERYTDTVFIYVEERDVEGRVVQE